MIPYKALELDRRNAQVLNGSLPTEKHGEDNVAFLDVKFTLLLDMDEINSLLDPDESMVARPAELIFHQETRELLMPAVKSEAALRDKIKGDLTIRGKGPKDLVFEGAHTVGKANKLEFITGGHGQLTMVLRLPCENVPQVVKIIEQASCSFEFAETGFEGASGKAEGDDGQEQMPV